MSLPSAIIDALVAYVRERGHIHGEELTPFYSSVPELQSKQRRDELRWRLTLAISQSGGRLITLAPDPPRKSPSIKVVYVSESAAGGGAESAEKEQCSCCQREITLGRSRVVEKKAAHKGQWRNHSITGYCCAIDVDSQENGRYVLCRHKGGIIQSSHWSCCGNQSHFCPPCGFSEESPTDSRIRDFDHVVCATGNHRVCKKCVREKIARFNDQFRTGGARSMLSDTGPTLCPCDYVLPAKVAIACVEEAPVVSEYVDSIVKVKSEIIYSAFQKSFVSSSIFNFFDRKHI